MATGKPLAGRIALITGASRGIGRATARAVAAAGAHVILLARTVGALEELDDEIRADGGSATLVPLDLKSLDKLDALGPSLIQRWDRLDILIACAGILGPLSPLGHVTADAWNDVMMINLTANWRLIRTLDPLLRRSDAGRAVFVTSGAARNCSAYWGPYTVSKAGLEALARTYAAEVESTPVRVNLLSPGPVRTGMRASAFPGEKPETLPPPEELAGLFLALVDPAQTANGQTFAFAEWTAARAQSR